MGLVSGGEGVGKVGEFAMEALEAVQYNTHPIDQVWFNLSCLLKLIEFVEFHDGWAVNRKTALIDLCVTSMQPSNANLVNVFFAGGGKVQPRAAAERERHRLGAEPDSGALPQPQLRPQHPPPLLLRPQDGRAGQEGHRQGRGDHRLDLGRFLHLSMDN